jgi:hypothetical protein
LNKRLNRKIPHIQHQKEQAVSQNSKRRINRSKLKKFED